MGSIVVQAKARVLGMKVGDLAVLPRSTQVDRLLLAGLLVEVADDAPIDPDGDPGGFYGLPGGFGGRPFVDEDDDEST